MDEILAENRRRLEAAPPPAHPASGRGCSGKRVKVAVAGTELWLPEAMIDDPRWPLVGGGGVALERLRIAHDFEFWAWRCVTIRDKLTGRNIPFTLNPPQRQVLEMLEEDRIANRPIRLILLKARQWGGSTLIQVYMAWIQIVHVRSWNSIICAHLKDASATIRGMYARLLANYPDELWEEEKKPEFRAFEGARNTRFIPGRECCVTLGTSESPEASRGADLAMAHLSEVAFWKSSTLHDPADLVRAISGGIALAPLTMVVLESTANGMGDFFHNEWLRARQGLSDKRTVFVAWFQMPAYALPVSDAAELWQSLDPYERALWDQGLTLEQINWYHCKRREMASHQKMMAEYPTTDTEAFSCTGSGVFHIEQIERLRQGCLPPMVTGELDSHVALKQPQVFTPDPLGRLKVWQKPRKGYDYLAVVDVGGRSDKSDYSVVAVMRRPTDVARAEIVAQWRGHCDHDVLAWNAARIAAWYNDALLVIESNTLETSTGAAGQPSTLLHEIGTHYDNLYHRNESEDAIGRCTGPKRPGFHTNVRTKSLVITRLIATVRDCGYIERDNEACNEMANYEQLANGSYAARAGCHDDILMTRAIALYVAWRLPL